MRVELSFCIFKHLHLGEDLVPVNFSTPTPILSSIVITLLGKRELVTLHFFGL